MVRTVLRPIGQWFQVRLFKDPQAGLKAARLIKQFITFPGSPSELRWGEKNLNYTLAYMHTKKENKGKKN